MARRRYTLLSTFGLAALLGATLLVADERVTVTMRSGERIDADLVDMGAAFTLRVNGQERQVSIGEVAIIDFAGGGRGAEASAGDGPHLLVLRDGRTFPGTLDDIGGNQPLQIFFIVSGDRRSYPSNSIDRIYLVRPQKAAQNQPPPPPAATPAPPGAIPAGAITVSARDRWTSTGINVRQGSAVTFESTGQVRLSTDTQDLANPAGSVRGRSANNAPIPSIPAGALIGRIGNSQPFAVGNLASITMPASGPLYLGVNDDELSDNDGAFYVAVRGAGRRR